MKEATNLRVKLEQQLSKEKLNLLKGCALNADQVHPYGDTFEREIEIELSYISFMIAYLIGDLPEEKLNRRKLDGDEMLGKI